MARDPWTELRSVLIEQVSKLWGYDPKTHASKIVPETLRAHVDKVQTRPLPEKIADEIVDSLAAVDESLAKLQDDESGKLPMIARLRPRGYFEDNWAARPSEERPWPVVLIHGTGATSGNWQELAHELREDGWAVFAPGYGARATNPIQQSAHEVGQYIEAVLARTGADRVIVVGHSQGGLVARYWMRYCDGADKVHHLVSLAVPHHGTTLGGVISPLIKTKMAENLLDSFVSSWFGPAGFQQVVGSPIVEALADGGDTDEEVDGYTSIATRSDSVIQPPETCFLVGDNVRNLWVQDVDPHAVVMHEDMPQDRRVRRLVAATLRRVAAQAAQAAREGEE